MTMIALLQVGGDTLRIRTDQIASIEHSPRGSRHKAIIVRVCDGKSIDVDVWPADISSAIREAEDC